jgi:hypothetical protein
MRSHLILDHPNDPMFGLLVGGSLAAVMWLLIAGLLWALH